MYKRSSQLFKEANIVIPGGVNSPVRAFHSVGGEPVFIKNAKGAYLYDEDNNKYIDYINSWGPMILGHAFQSVVEAITDQTKKGISFGTPTELEVEMARLMVNMVPWIDKVRMVNSGTEACMSVIRLARGYTGKDKIIKFMGCYHGHSDAFLIKAGSGALTLGSPDSAGVTRGTAKDTLLANFNDIENVKQVIDNNKGEIAAIILEPVAGNMGCIPPKEGFLKALRDLCTNEGIVLIFDEVMTGFRLAKGGAQELFGIQADLVTYGKVIGGGMPVGAFAGKRDIIDCIAPEGKVYQAGTLSGNPIAMSAGFAMLTELYNHPDIYKELQEKTLMLEEGFESILSEKSIPYQINNIQSMISIFFCENEVVDFDTATKANGEIFKKFFYGMFHKGVYIPPSVFETWFICNALSNKDIIYTLETAEEVLSKI